MYIRIATYDVVFPKNKFADVTSNVRLCVIAVIVANHALYPFLFFAIKAVKLITTAPPE